MPRLQKYTARSAAAVLTALSLLLGGQGGALGADDDRAVEGDRRDRRSGELALPDPYLDPAWPDESSPGAGAGVPVMPEQSDSVERAPIQDEVADRAELEEMQRYKEALGLPTGPDDFTQDHWDEEQPAAEPDGENDPPEW